MFVPSAVWLMASVLVSVRSSEHYLASDEQVRDPISPGQRSWTDALARAKDMVSNLTNEEKNSILIGQASSVMDFLFPKGGCVGRSAGIAQLGFPGFCLQDGPAGVRGTDLVSAYPSGIHIGATWNRDLARKVGLHMGAEFKRKGVHVALGPDVGALGRVAKGGRNWEGYSNDPYLAGKLAADTIRGLQESVIACIKHLIGNEQETNRGRSIFASTKAVSSNIDDRTMHELYLWPFDDAVQAGAGCAMCSYNRVNGTYACENDKVMNGLLKNELGFKGFVVSDWNAQNSGVVNAKAGMDLVMPNAALWGNNTLSKAASSGNFSQARLDDMATRILGTWLRFGMDAKDWPSPGVGLAASLTAPHPLIDGRDPSSKPILFQSAVEGHVLVKNKDQALPLKSPKLLSLFGYDGPAPLLNNPTSAMASPWSLSVNSNTDLGLIAMITAGGIPPNAARAGTLISGGGSGGTTGPYYSAPYNAFEQQAYNDGTYLHWDFSSTSPNINGASEACIVFINEFAIEGLDRNVLADPESDKLVNNVAKGCKNTMVVIHNAGVRLVDAWIEHPNITAVIYAHLPGQDSGRALVEIMYGKQSPSGRLPYTVAKRESDYGSLLDPTLPKGKSDDPQSDFKEGVYIDYRAFMRNKVTPRFPFGFGLSYTSFNYTDLTVSPVDGQTLAQGNSPTAVVAKVSCTITNTGDVSAAEVPQLYVSIPDAPELQLRGFEKQTIEPGKSAKIEFILTRRDLSIWSVKNQQWVLQSGRYRMHVGANLLDLPLRGELEVAFSSNPGRV